MTKRQPDDSLSTAAADQRDLLRRLSEHGEAFMRMFDDYNEEERRIGSAACPQAEASAYLPQNCMEDGSDAEEDTDQLPFLEAKRSHKNAQSLSRVQGHNHQRAAMVKQRKLFMSGRSLDPNIKLGAKLPLPRTEQGPSTDADITPQDFEKMRREVALLGASALGKKQRKRFKASMLSKLNAKAEKASRIPASVGKGMARKQKQREQAALERTIEAGMLQRKGLGKKCKVETKKGKGKTGKAR